MAALQVAMLNPEVNLNLPWHSNWDQYNMRLLTGAGELRVLELNEVIRLLCSSAPLSRFLSGKSKKLD